MNVGILGGTFDPPHIGHLELAQIARDSGLIDSVLLVPCARHAFGKTPVDFSHRLKMCELLVQDEPQITASDIESRFDSQGKTIDLLEQLRHWQPSYKYRLVVGSDIYLERTKWYKFDEVARLAPPIYVARKGCPEIDVPTLKAPVAVNSTKLRLSLSNGIVPVDFLTKPVVDYILSNRLYGV